MKAMKFLIFLIVIPAGVSFFFQSCTSVKKNSTITQQGTKLPSEAAITPSSFRCEAIVLSNDSSEISLKIGKILQRGAALYFEVGSGDTIAAKYASRDKENIITGSALEILVEERQKMNSEKPDFILRQFLKMKNN